jgi:hypothetical protein
MTDLATINEIDAVIRKALDADGRKDWRFDAWLDEGGDVVCAPDGVDGPDIIVPPHLVIRFQAPGDLYDLRRIKLVSGGVPPAFLSEAVRSSKDAFERAVAIRNA